MSNTLRSPRQRHIMTEIARARLASGMTQAQVAVRLNRHQPFIANIESGQRRVDLVELMAIGEIIKLDLHALLDELGRLPS